MPFDYQKNPISGRSLTDPSSSNDVAWQNISYAVDGTYGTYANVDFAPTFPTYDRYSNLINLYDFQLNIPSTARILSFTFYVYKYYYHSYNQETYPGNITDYSVYLTYLNSSNVLTYVPITNPNTSVWPIVSNYPVLYDNQDFQKSYWTASEVNQTNFGIAIGVTGQNVANYGGLTQSARIEGLFLVATWEYPSTYVDFGAGGSKLNSSAISNYNISNISPISVKLSGNAEYSLLFLDEGNSVNLILSGNSDLFNLMSLQSEYGSFQISGEAIVDHFANIEVSGGISVAPNDLNTEINEICNLELESYGLIISGESEVEATILMTVGIFNMSGEALVEYISTIDISGGTYSGLSNSYVTTNVIYEIQPETGNFFIAGQAFDQILIPMNGGINIQPLSILEIGYVMLGGIYSGGIIEFVAIYNIDLDILPNNLKIGGSSKVNYGKKFDSYISSGEVFVEDQASYGMTSSIKNMAGLVEVHGNSTTNFVFIKNTKFLWSINSLIIKQFNFIWNVGLLNIYWYRVVGKGRTDPCLPQEKCCQQVIMNVHARTITELCQKLKRRRFKFPIESVQKYSRPAQNAVVAENIANGINEDCNILELVDVCNVPACFEYCVTLDFVIDCFFSIKVTVNAYHFFESTGQNLDVSGSATCSYKRYLVELSHTASGSITVTGSPYIYPNHYTGYGRAKVGGKAFISSNRWNYLGGVWPNTTGIYYPQYNIFNSTSNLQNANEQVWSLPERIYENDGLYTSTDISYGKTSQALIVKGFNLSIPEWAEVSKIIVRTSIKSTQVGVRDLQVCLVNQSGIISDNLANKSSDWPLIDTVRTYGQNGWRNLDDSNYSGNITGQDISDENFGILLKVKASSSLFATIAKVDYFNIEVQYQHPNGSYIKIDSNVGSSYKGKTYYWTTSGNVKITGTPQYKLRKKFNILIIPSGVGISGTFPILINESSSGGSSIGGEAKVTPYDETTSGGINLSGYADVIPYEDSMYGGIRLGGKSVDSAKYKYSAKGNLVLTGDFRIVKIYSFEPSGSLEVSESAFCRCDFYTFKSNGASLSINGSAEMRAGNINLDPVVSRFSIAVYDIKVYFTKDVHLGDTTVVQNTLDRCGCFRLPEIINFTHNFSIDNLLAKFLIKNGFTISKNIELKYNSINDSWQNNLHYKGIAPDGNNLETWDIVLELQCTNVVGSIAIGRSILKLSLQFFRRDAITGHIMETRITVSILPEIICNSSSNQLDYTINFDTYSKIATVSPDSTIYQSTIFDNIGLFKNAAWITSNTLILNVSQVTAKKPIRRFDLTPFAVF